MIKISVVIPVYNAEKYLEEAVDSAFMQEEVAEVILVEDGSTDGSFEVCKKISDKYEKVFLYQHPDGENKGAGETRNLGIKKSNSKFIAFLDADDFYLPERFKTARHIFKSNDNVDGVYEAIGSMFESEDQEKRWKAEGRKLITTLNRKVAPDKLFEYLVFSGGGHFHLDGLTVKKEIFKKTGLFEKKLLMSQDTNMCLKMALVGKLIPGEIKSPVAIRRVHGNNRITNVKKDELRNYRYLLWELLYIWSKKAKIGFSEKIIIEYKAGCYKELREKKSGKEGTSLDYFFFLSRYLIKNFPIKSLILVWKLLVRRFILKFLG